MNKNAIVLAAGKGTRMKSELSKLLHPIIDRPMLAYTLEAIDQAGVNRVVIINGYQAEQVEKAFPGREFALQEPQLGTGHAVMQAQSLKDEKGYTLVINGDGPCIQSETLNFLFDQAQGSALTLMSCIFDEGAHYGRILRDENGEFLAIREAKDCTEEEKKVNEINAGVYCFNNEDLFESLQELTSSNAQNEYYLTDLVEILKGKGKKVKAIPIEDPDELQGINDPIELYAAYSWVKDRINQNWMKKGVQIVDPARTVIGKDVVIGHDVIIHPNTELLGSTVVSDYAEILPGSYLKNADVQEGEVVGPNAIRVSGK
ncbi:NTP transferase domain-containing protein [Ileibacterium valens]|uniref:NTP transferase domain-containing protein n=1 Tax=Ileibacterium valens TaxID=1862668 RepID=UPI0024BA85FC|nr:NTP transferase domain-containing protein [Ileibacterium valens]